MTTSSHDQVNYTDFAIFKKLLSIISYCFKTLTLNVSFVLADFRPTRNIEYPSVPKNPPL